MTALRAVNFPVGDEDACVEFYRDRLTMHCLPDVLPDGTMCRWDRENDQFVGLRPREGRGQRRWRYPYGRCRDWDHVELYLDGTPSDVSPVETHAEALVLADPEERAVEALLARPGPREVPGISEVGLSVVEMDRTRDYYERLGFEPGGWDGTDRFVLRASSGQRWVLVDGDRPGFHHVAFALDPARFRAVETELSEYPHRGEGERLRVTDPEGRELILSKRPA